MSGLSTIYHPYNKIKNPFKNEMNDRLVKSILNTYPNISNRQKLKVIVFDGIMRRTSKQLMDIGIRRENILLIERDDMTFHIHSKSGFRCIFGEADKIFGSKNTGDEYDIVVLDAIGQAKNIFNIMKLMLLNKYVKSNAIFASTFNRRGKISFGATFRSCKNMLTSHQNIVLNDVEMPLFYGMPRNGQANMVTYFWQINAKKIKF